MEPRTLLSAVTGTGGAGDNNWDTAANWNTDSVPGSADDVTIDIAANVVHSDDVSDSINSLTSAEPLTISGGTLSIASASTIGGALTISGGTLTGAGDVSVGGLVTLTAGTLSGSSTLNANGGMLINPADEETPFNLDGRTLNNAAGQTATWTGELGFIEGSDGSVFNNLGTFVAEAPGIFEDSGIGAPSAFNDAGTFTTSGDNVAPLFEVPFNVPGGSVETTGDNRLDVDGGGTSTGGVFHVNGLLGVASPYLFDATTTIDGTGTLQTTGGGTLVLPGNYAFAGSIDILHGNVQVDGSFADAAVAFSDTGDGDLSGTGTVGAIAVGGITVSPGDGPDPGILNARGDVQFVAVANDSGQGSTYSVVLNGPTAGTGYSQLNVSGQVDLGGSVFNPTLGFTPADGEQFTIIKSTAPIVGTFASLPEGASFMIDDSPFTITYAGGDGDDVVLTQAVASAPTVTGISPNSGPEAGGTAVTIAGTGFTGATAVDFGTTAATNVTVVNSTTITANSPAGTGAADVTVITRSSRWADEAGTATWSVTSPASAPPSTTRRA